MSRDTTAWSVKGIDQATRDIARRAASAAGMTIGEWIDHAIKSDSANRGVPVPANQSDRSGGNGPAAPPRMEGINPDTVEAIFSRISDGERLFEARLRPIGYALKDVAERVVALEREADRLPAPETRSIEAEPQPESRPEPRPEPPTRIPIAFRPMTPEQPVLQPAPAPVEAPPPAPDSPMEVEVDDDIWGSDLPAPAPAAADTAENTADDLAQDPQSERPRPQPIKLHPIPTPAPEDAAESIDFGSVSRDEARSVPPPEGPPRGWEPAVDIDRAALARASADLPSRSDGGVSPETDADAFVEPEAIPPSPRSLDGLAGPHIDDDPTTLRERPDPVAPAYDFPADPIDTRALGLSGEPIPTPLPPRRIASAGRLAVAAGIVLALLGGAAWTAHREGTLSLGAIGDRLAEAEYSIHLALTGATDWVMHQVGTTEHAAEDVAAPHPAPNSPAEQETVAAAPDRAPSASDGTGRETGGRQTDDRMAGATATPATDPGSPAGTGSDAAEPQTAESSTETPKPIDAPHGAPQGAPRNAPLVAAAPPLPETAIDVDPRPVAPPPAPALSAPAVRTSPAAAPSSQGTAPMGRAEAGNPAAQFEVAAGMMRAAEPRPAEAATWFREAAINGLDVAQFNLGVMYERGLGVPEDQTRALLWYHSAAEQGHPLAQYNLGRLYALGKGIPQSDAEAKRWFQRAADRGVSDALYAMATFEPGEMERERMMYSAAKAGAEQAQEWLRVKSAGGVPEAPLSDMAGLVLDSPTGAPDIAAIQEGLADLGYYSGPIDGIAGPVTRAAIGKFQSDNGLPATGLPSRSLRQRLN